MRHALLLQGVENLVWLSRTPEAGYRLDADDQAIQASLSPDGQLSLDGDVTEVCLAVAGDRVYVHIDGQAYELLYLDPVSRFGQQAGGASDRVLRAPMPGAVVSLDVVPGQAVAAGDTLVIIESMKLETAIRSPRNGTVEVVHVATGDPFERDAPLITLAEA
jgi:biotin carboxyl carrier protein